MQTQTAYPKSDINNQTLQLNRKLITIEEYSSKHGVNIDTIEQYGRLGYLEIRRFKGKSFVVDVPMNRKADIEIDASDCNFDADNQQVAEHLDVSEPTEALDAVEEYTEENIIRVIEDDEASFAAELENEEQRQDFEITEELIATIDEFEGQQEIQAAGKDEIATESKIVTESSTSLGDYPKELNDSWILTEALRKTKIRKLVWKLVACVFLTGFCAAAIASLWFFTGRELTEQRLDNAYISLQEVHKSHRAARMESENIQQSYGEMMIAVVSDALEAGARKEQENIQKMQENYGELLMAVITEALETGAQKTNQQ